MEEGGSQIPNAENKKPTPRVGELPRIRTYAADMSEAIKTRGETLASIVNKERTAPGSTRVAKEAPSFSLKRMAIVLGSIVLVVAGVGVVIGVFIFNPRDEVEIQTPGIIFANEEYTITPGIDGSYTDQLTVVRRGQNLSLGEIMRIDLVENGMVVTGQTLAQRLNIPSALTREVTDAMVGIHAFDRNQPFIILRTQAYDRSFAAILEWEKQMGRSLGSFFAPTGTVGTVPLLTFSDAIIQNTDVRTSGNEWPILYTFATQDLLIITTNEFTLKEILSRLAATRASF